MTKTETLAYIAGFIDGEGYIGIKKDIIKGRGVSPVFYERMSVAGINKPSIDFLAEFFKGGKIYLHKTSKLSRRGYWSWEVSNKICVAIIKQIYPYLKIKKPEADLVLKLSKSKKKKYYVLSKRVINFREKLYQGVKSLHTF